jgi:hypothetical protein
LISLIDPCNLYFQSDNLFALLVVSSVLPNVCMEILLAFIPIRVSYMVFKHVMSP